jgi:hydrogenase maturation protease
MDVVVAYGNPLRGDDGVAWRVAELLRSHGSRIVLTQQLTPEIALELRGVKRVVFVDAAVGGEAGRVTSAPVDGSPSAATSAHHLSPASVLAYARCLNGEVPQAFIVSIAGQDFGLGESLSCRVQAALPEAVRRVRAMLDTASLADEFRVEGLGGREPPVSERRTNSLRAPRLDEGPCTS